MLILLFTFAACSDVSFNPENDADLSLASSSESLFDFIEVNEDHVGIMGLEARMTQEEVIENLNLDENELKILNRLKIWILLVCIHSWILNGLSILDSHWKSFFISWIMLMFVLSLQYLIMT